MTGTNLNNSASSHIDRLRASLLPEDLEARFLLDYLTRKRRHLAFILLCAAVLSLLFMIPDALLLAKNPIRAGFNRWLSLSFSIYTLGTIWALCRITQPRRWKITLSAWWLLAIITICLGNTAYPAGSINYMFLDVLIPVAICLLTVGRPAAAGCKRSRSGRHGPDDRPVRRQCCLLAGARQRP